jgi:cytochrome bd ubiquinol oxidase subunit II
MTMVMFWVALLAISILIYLLLDGFDLGIGILSGLARSETRRSAMLGTVAPVWTATRHGWWSPA